MQHKRTDRQVISNEQGQVDRSTGGRAPTAPGDPEGQDKIDPRSPPDTITGQLTRCLIHGLGVPCVEGSKVPDHQMTRSASPSVITQGQQVGGVQEARRIHGERNDVMCNDPRSTATRGTGWVISQEGDPQASPRSRAPRLVITGLDHTTMFPQDHRLGLYAERRGEPRRSNTLF